jgi:CRP-like cAMP-binding protein
VSVVSAPVSDPLGSSTENTPLSLGTGAARNLATTTKSVPQMQEISSRWLLRMLPWVQVSGGVYRVNRRMAYTVGDGRVTFDVTGSRIRVIARDLCDFPSLREFGDAEVLGALADRFEQREFAAGDVVVERGHAADEVVLVAHGKLHKLGRGEYGDEVVLDVMARGDYLGDRVLAGTQSSWDHTIRAVTPGTALVLSRRSLQELLDQSEPLRSHLAAVRARPERYSDSYREAAIALAAGHDGEPDLPGTFVDYEASPREYELSVAQTVLRIHSRVADLYNDPMDQVEQQLRLTVEALRERQEDELLNNRAFGLLHNAGLGQRLHTHTGPVTPDDMDRLLAAVWKEPAFFLANPRTIAAFGRECTRRGIYPESVEVGGNHLPAWRGVPLLPCGKVPVSDTNTSSILLMRTGEASQGVVGLHQTGIPDEYQPSLSVRFMGVSEKGIISYLVSAYYSVAVLVPDALGILQNVEIGRDG